MVWHSFGIAFLTIAVLAALSWRADRRLPSVARLPMQWAAGETTWTAPRKVALLFTPALASALLFGTTAVVAAADHAERPIGVAVIGVMSAAFAAAHALHLRLIERSIRL